MSARLIRMVALAALTLIVPRLAASDEPALDVHPQGDKHWSVYASAGMQYDSNVALDPTGQRLPGAPANPADGGGVFSAGGRYDFVDTARWQASLEYDFYQTAHFRLHDFDLRSNRVAGTAGYSLVPDVWTGVQAGYQHYVLGVDPYSGAPFVTPFVSWTQQDWGLTQFVYEHAHVTYLSQPFENVRDGPTDTASLNQTVYWGSRYVTIGYEFGSERPQSHSVFGESFRERYHQVGVGFGFSPGWRTTVDLAYLFRYENYPASEPALGTTRQDTVNQFSVSVRRPVTRYLSAGLTYYGTFDNSNVAVYQYRRNIVSAEVRVVF